MRARMKALALLLALLLVPAAPASAKRLHDLPCVEGFYYEGHLEGQWAGRLRRYPLRVVICGAGMADNDRIAGWAIFNWPGGERVVPLQGTINSGKKPLILREPVRTGNGVFTGYPAGKGYGGSYRYYRPYRGLTGFRWRLAPCKGVC